MKTDKEWEARALEVAIPTSSHGLWGIHHTEPWMNVTTALQLGREMAAEVAADYALRMADLAERSGAAIRADERERICRRLWVDAKVAEERLGSRTGYVVGVEFASERARHDDRPKAREQVLEEALRGFIARHEGPCAPKPCAAIVADMLDTARRALEWKP